MNVKYLKKFFWYDFFIYVFRNFIIINLFLFFFTYFYDYFLEFI